MKNYFIIDLSKIILKRHKIPGSIMAKSALPFLVILLFAAVNFNCSKSTEKQKGSPAYIKQIQEWHHERIENLKKEDGWLNLVGLYWLKEGANKFGSGKDNDIIFPKGKAPLHIGSLFLKDGSVTIKVDAGIKVTYNGKPVKSMKLVSDEENNPTVLAIGTLRFFIIKRNDKTGVRLRDLDAPLLKQFKGTKMFPINEDWKITADFTPFNKPKLFHVNTIIGTVEQDTMPGYLTFKVKGKEFKLDPLKDDNRLFIIFADETSGVETYGAGRFLYADMPDSNGKVILDFNKAYNPPCSFTPYATCPLPPKQNFLKLKITAGELKYGEGHE